MGEAVGDSEPKYLNCNVYYNDYVTSIMTVQVRFWCLYHVSLGLSGHSV